MPHVWPPKNRGNPGRFHAAKRGPPEYRVRTRLSGCAGEYFSAIKVGADAEGGIALRFEGEALARAAVERMALVLDDLEAGGGKSREAAGAFVIHQPNPRLVETFARRASIPLEKIPRVAKGCGNLGSSTCGVALSLALEEHGSKPRVERGPIFLATVGPGLMCVGLILE